MLTIFTTCAPFEGDRARIQRNAITSWFKNIHPTPEILIMSDGRENGVKEFVNQHDINIKLIPVEYTAFGVPSLVSMFKKAKEIASNDILCYSDADDIHFQSLMNAVRDLSQSKLKEWVATGRHHDVKIDFDIDWGTLNIENIDNLVKEKGKMESASAGDYFIFPKTMDWSHMPDFVAGDTPNWDTWINADVLERGIPLIDVTENVFVVHQDHERHWNYDQDKSKKNVELAGTKSVGSDMATHVLNMGMVFEKQKRKVEIS